MPNGINGVFAGDPVWLVDPATGAAIGALAIGAAGVPFVGLADNADAVAATATANRMAVMARNAVFNGATWDRASGDRNGAVVQPALSSTFWAVNANINNSAAGVAIKAAAGAGVRNYIRSAQFPHNTLGGTTDIYIRDGAAGAVLWRGALQTAGSEGICINFDPPLRGSANTLVEVQCGAAVTGSIYPNLQGYTGV